MRFTNPNRNAASAIDRIDIRLIELGLQTKEAINQRRTARGERAIAGDGSKSNPYRPAKR